MRAKPVCIGEHSPIGRRGSHAVFGNRQTAHAAACTVVPRLFSEPDGVKRCCAVWRRIDSVHWSVAKVSVDVTRQAVKDSPPFAHTAPLDRQQEASLYEHYGRCSYWADDLKRDTELSRI